MSVSVGVIVLSSHDLARALLARRDNDVRIEVIVSEGDDKHYAITTELRDYTELGYKSQHHVESKDVVVYDPTSDTIVIKAGWVYDSE
jgi:hypothetical protein